MAVEQTLILAKPDAVGRSLAGEIMARFERRGLTLREVLACVSERGSEPLGAERFEQVIERVDFERGERVFVVRGDEDNGRHVLAERARECEAIHLRHLDVEKHQVGRGGLDDGDGLRSRRAFADDFDVGFVA